MYASLSQVPDVQLILTPPVRIPVHKVCIHNCNNHSQLKSPSKTMLIGFTVIICSMMKQSGEKLTTTSILVNVGYKDDSVMFGINLAAHLSAYFEIHCVINHPQLVPTSQRSWLFGTCNRCLGCMFEWT